MQAAICRCLQLVLLVTAAPALAQHPETETVSLRLGIGYGQHSSVLYEQEDREFYLLPRLQIYYKRAYLENLDLGFNLFEHQNWALDLTGKQSFDALLTRGNSLKDSLFSGLIGLDKPIFMPGGPNALKDLITPVKRHFSYLAGATLYYHHDQWLITQSWHQDISKVHHGSELQTSLSYRYLKDGYGIALTGSVRRIDGDYSNYYFGPMAEDFRKPIYLFFGSADDVIRTSKIL